MIPRDVKSPTIPIPFHKLLKVVAIVDEKDPLTRELLDHIAAEDREFARLHRWRRARIARAARPRVLGNDRASTGGSPSMLTSGISQPRQPQLVQRNSRSADRLRRMRSRKLRARDRWTRSVMQLGQY